jgi:hypothetical protein
MEEVGILFMNLNFGKRFLFVNVYNLKNNYKNW